MLIFLILSEYNLQLKSFVKMYHSVVKDDADVAAVELCYCEDELGYVQLLSNAYGLLERDSIFRKMFASC